MRATEKAIAMLVGVGFNLIGCFQRSKVLGLRDCYKDEYIRFFIPQIIIINGSKALVGTMGSLDRSAIADWLHIDRLGNYYALSAFSANFPELRSPPIFGLDEEADLGWCEKIRNVVSQFPRSCGELQGLINESKKIAGFMVSRMDSKWC